MSRFLNVGIIQMSLSLDTATNLKHISTKVDDLMQGLHRPEVDFKNIHAMNKVGFAAFAIQIAMTGITITINNLLGVYGGDLDMAAYGVINAYILYVFTTLTQSFCFGVLPIASYNYGAKLYARVQETLRVSVTRTLLFLVILIVLLFMLANPILQFFCGNNPELIGITKSAMKIFLILYPLGGVTFVISAYFQAIEHNGKAIFNGISRNFIFVIPLLFLLSKLGGIKGLWAAQPISDLLAFCAGLYFVYKEFNRLKDLDNNKKSLDNVS